MNHVLIIDCDLSVCEDIKSNLQNELIDVYYTQFIEEAMQNMRKIYYTLIILDPCLSVGKEIVLIEQIRRSYSTPIFVLSKTASTAYKVAALRSGADDFLSKPYDLEECLARALALIRRYTQLNNILTQSYAFISHGDVLLDIARRQVSIDNEIISLTRKEYDLLLYFVKNRNRVLTFEQIYDAVWHEEYLMDNSTIFCHVGNLRKKLGANWIETKYGVGYNIINPDKL